MRVCWGRAWEDAGAPVYWPWTQVLGGLAEDEDDVALLRHLGPGAAEAAQILPQLGPRLGIAGASAPTGDAPGARFRLFEAVSDFLHAVSADGPLLVILEDLHAADEASISLLQFICRHLERSPILVVGTYRAPEVLASPRRLGLITGVAREGGHLMLSGLAPPSVSELLERASGVTPTPETAMEIYEVTEGNPFFVGEVARLLGGSLAVVHRRVPVPDAVQAVIRGRLGGCDDRLVAVLGAAAVVGRDFDLAALSGVAGRNVHQLLDDLGEAARHRVVEEIGLNRWSFVHALVRETLYEGLTLGERVRLHRAAAETFERLSPDAFAEIAHHRFESARTGTDASRSVDACETAAQRAAAVLAFEDAAHWFGRALEVLERQPAAQRRRYDLLMAVGESLLRGGSRAEGRATYLRAAQIARSIGDAERLARAALGFYGLHEDVLDAHDHSRRVLIEEALAALPDEDSALRARLIMCSGRWDEFDPEDFGGKARAAVDMARRVGDQSTLAEILWNWHYGHSSPAHLDERLRVADELVDLANQSGSREQLVLALQWRLSDRFEAADVSGARADLRLGLREAEDLRLPFPLWGITDMRSTVELLEGRLDEAERTIADARTLGRRISFPLAEMRCAARIAVVRWNQGRFEEMAALTRDACEVLPREYAHPRILLGIALAEAGHRDEARLELDRILAEDSWSWYRRVHRESSAGHLAELCWLIGEPGPAAALVDALQPFAGGHLVWGIMGYSLGSVDRYLGQLFSLQGRFQDAEAHFEAAHRLHERLGAPWFWARGAVDHARMLRARGLPGDDQRSAGLAARAGSRFAAIGATVHAERATALVHPGDRTEFRLVDGEWAVRFGGVDVRLRDSKGMHYLASLLRCPCRPIHAQELIGERPLGQDDASHRLRELQDEIDEARADHDLGRLERAENAFDDVLNSMQAATSAAQAERARQSASRAIKGAIDRIAAVHPELGRYLRTTVRTGVQLSYRPDPRSPIRWDT